MYYAIVFLPLLGAIVAGLIALAGAHARHPGGPPVPGTEDRAAARVVETHARAAPSPDAPHAAADETHHEPERIEPAASGSRAAEIATTVLLFGAMLLSWFAFAEVGFFQRESRVSLFPWIFSG